MRLRLSAPSVQPQRAVGDLCGYEPPEWTQVDFLVFLAAVGMRLEPDWTGTVWKEVQTTYHREP